MIVRTFGIAAITTTLLTSSAFAQTNFPEIEPNSVKTEATAVNGIVANDTITGTTTGTTVTAGSTVAASVDMYRVKTGALALGIYKHTLTLSSTTTGQIGSIRGVTQTAGAPTTTDTEFQTSVASANSWYGFGKQEEIYYRVTGGAATTGAYTATLTSAAVTPITVPGLYNPGPITVTTSGQGHTTDTEIYLYDSALNPVPLGHNDDIVGVGVGQSKVVVTLAAGTYYIALDNYNMANNVGDANPSENFLTGPLLDFPDAIANNPISTATNVGFSVSDGTTTTPVAASKTTGIEIVWATFTVQTNTNPPANDACANATVIGNGTFGGLTTYATQDGVASCDPGGAASRDVWFSYTNTTGVPIVFSADTCSSSIDTVLSVYSSCGGTELACSDDCGGSPCSATSSCISGVAMSVAQTVLIRVSDKGLTGGVFVLHVAGGLSNDDCSTPYALPGQGVFPFDDTLATTGPQPAGLCPTNAKNDLWYTYTATTNGGSCVVSTSGGQITSVDTDTIIAVYAGIGCSGTGVVCDDDGGDGSTSLATFTTTCGTTYTIRLGNYFTGDSVSGTFSVTETGPACATAFTPYCSGDGSDTACPCSNPGLAGRGCENTVSSGGALLTSSGIASVASPTLVLNSTFAVPFGPGLYYEGNATALPGPQFGATFGNGLRCAGGATNRLEIRFADGTGAANTTVDLQAFGAAVASTTYYYQQWYRDTGSVGSCSPGAGFNLSNAISLTWAP